MKLFTYQNPFEIKKQPYWDDIKSSPHLCVSQTLVQVWCPITNVPAFPSYIP